MQLLCFLSHFRALVRHTAQGKELAQSRIILSTPLSLTSPSSSSSFISCWNQPLILHQKRRKASRPRHSKGGPSDYNNPILLWVSLRGFSPCAECRNVIPLWACAPQTCNQHTPATSFLGSLLLSYGTKTQKNNNLNEVAGAVIAVPIHSGIKMPGSLDPTGQAWRVCIRLHRNHSIACTRKVKLQASQHTVGQHHTLRMQFHMKLWRLGEITAFMAHQANVVVSRVVKESHQMMKCYSSR